MFNRANQVQACIKSYFCTFLTRFAVAHCPRFNVVVLPTSETEVHVHPKKIEQS